MIIKIKSLYNIFIRVFHYIFAAEFLSRFSRWSSRPSVIFLGITNLCNMKCEFCFQYNPKESSFHLREKGYMNDETFSKFLNQVTGWVSYINLNLFGEPTIHPQLGNYLQQMSDRDLKVNLITNGKKVSDNLIEKIVQSRTFQVSFSLEIESYNTKRIGGDFNQTVDTIQRLVKKRGSKNWPMISVQSLKSKSFSKNEILNHQKFLKELGVDKIDWIEPKNWTGEISNDTSQMTGTIINRCLHPWTSLAVDWDGKVTSCCEDFSYKNNHGNINDIDIKKIWNSSSKRRLRQILLSKDSEAIEKNTGCHNCTLLIEKTGLSSAQSFRQNIRTVFEEVKKLV